MKERLVRSSADPAGAERARTCREARLAFLRDHLCWWAPSFATLVARKAGDGFYAAAARLLAALLPVDRSRLNIDAPSAPPKPADVDLSPLHECGACALAKM
jgi:hypothetical protein